MPQFCRNIDVNETDPSSFGNNYFRFCRAAFGQSFGEHWGHWPAPRNHGNLAAVLSALAGRGLAVRCGSPPNRFWQCTFLPIAKSKKHLPRISTTLDGALPRFFLAHPCKRRLGRAAVPALGHQLLFRGSGAKLFSGQPVFHTLLFARHRGFFWAFSGYFSPKKPSKLAWIAARQSGQMVFGHWRSGSLAHLVRLYQRVQRGRNPG